MTHYLFQISSIDHDVLYYHLPREFAHDFSLNTFLSSSIGRQYELAKLISVKVMVQLSVNWSNLYLCSLSDIT